MDDGEKPEYYQEALQQWLEVRAELDAAIAKGEKFAIDEAITRFGVAAEYYGAAKVWRGLDLDAAIAAEDKAL